MAQCYWPRDTVERFCDRRRQELLSSIQESYAVDTAKLKDKWTIAMTCSIGNKIVSGSLLVGILVASQSFMCAAADTGIKKERFESLQQTEYSYSSDICSLRIIAYDASSINSKLLSVRRSCARNFVEQVALLGLLLAELKNDGKLDSVHTISWGQISEAEVQIRLAKGALESSKWLAITEQNSKTVLNKSIPEVVVILNESAAFRELVNLMKALGYRLFVTAVEGVLVGRLGDIIELSALPYPEHSVVPYSTGVWFGIEPIRS